MPPRNEAPRTALVTGAASGLGAAVVSKLARAGWLVAGIDLRPSAAELSLIADVGDPGAMARAVHSVLSRFGGLTAAAGCAGAAPRDFQLVHETPEEGWDGMLRVNLTGQFHLAREVLPALVASHGSLCLVASVSARHPLPGAAAYGAAKAGVIALANSIAVEYGPHGVLVNVVSPGYMDTPMAAPTLSRAHLREGLEASIPTGQVATPESVAEVVCFLLSGGSPNLTGQEIVVDGALGLTSYAPAGMTRRLWNANG